MTLGLFLSCLTDWKCEDPLSRFAPFLHSGAFYWVDALLINFVRCYLRSQKDIQQSNYLSLLFNYKPNIQYVSVECDFFFLFYIICALILANFFTSCLSYCTSVSCSSSSDLFKKVRACSWYVLLTASCLTHLDRKESWVKWKLWVFHNESTVFCVLYVYPLAANWLIRLWMCIWLAVIRLSRGSRGLNSRWCWEFTHKPFCLKS